MPSERYTLPYGGVDEFADVLDRHGVEVDQIDVLDHPNQYAYYFGHVRGTKT